LNLDLVDLLLHLARWSAAVINFLQWQDLDREFFLIIFFSAAPGALKGLLFLNLLSTIFHICCLLQAGSHCCEEGKVDHR
jgi:hypothetical protein